MLVTSATPDADDGSPPGDNSGGGGGDGCHDVPTPDGKYTCQQQKDWGKCNEDFIKSNGFCKCTCSNSGGGSAPPPSGRRLLRQRR